MQIAPKSVCAIAQTQQSRSPEEHVRSQFESLRRQPQLATDLACFAHEGELSSIRYMAHPHGLHVARWLKVLAHTPVKVLVETANPIPAFSGDFVSAQPLVPRFFKIPMTLRYLLAGIVARFRRSHLSPGLVHAHCASGNGFVAWLSGQRYVIGTYGSEIFQADERGTVYRWLLKKILQGAERIADCSPECTKILREKFDIPADRIYSFHLGYDEKNFSPLDHSQRMRLRRDADLPVDEPIWIVNRRADPLYRTKEVVEGFLDYCQKNSTGRLVVLCGDFQPRYTEEICQIIQSHPQGHRIVVVKPLMGPEEFSRWLKLGDFSISVPRTDNFSIAILESMGCGTIPVLSDLLGYGELKPCRPVRWVKNFEPSDFSHMFAVTALSTPDDRQAERDECVRFVQAGYSTEKALRDIAAFYLGTPRHNDEFARKAA